MATHEEIVTAYESYLEENESFETKNIKAAAARARKALGELGKLAKVRRAEIQDKKNSLQKLYLQSPAAHGGEKSISLSLCHFSPLCAKLLKYNNIQLKS